jgi:hypothetical protein
MSTLKRFFGAINENRDEQQINKRIAFQHCNKRDVWNGRRRFGIELDFRLAILDFRFGHQLVWDGI